MRSFLSLPALLALAIIAIGLYGAGLGCVSLHHPSPAQPEATVHEHAFMRNVRARSVPFSETRFGVHLDDPYRWMETGGDELTRWAREQTDRTSEWLARLPGFATLTPGDNPNAPPSIDDAVLIAGKRFYLSRRPGADTKALVVADSAGRERVLVSVEADAGARAHSIDFFVPSPDGTLVVYGVSTAGAERSVGYVVNVASAEILHDRIDRIANYFVSWLPEQDSFFYMQLNNEAPRKQLLRNSIFLHRVGTESTADQPVLGNAAPGSPTATDDEFPFIMTAAGSPYVLGALRKGIDPTLRIFAARAQDVLAGTPRWISLAERVELVYDATIRGNFAFLQRHAPHRYGEVVQFDLQASPPRPRVALAAGTTLLSELRAARDGVYVLHLVERMTRLRRIDEGGMRVDDVALPEARSIRYASSSPTEDGIVVSADSWTQPPTWIHVRSPSAIEPLVPGHDEVDQDLVGATVEQRWVKARDGVRVPLTLIRPPGLTSAPSRVWLNVLGVQGTPYPVAYRASRAQWLKRGGVIAIAHVRGGGELGPEWHEQAIGPKKRKSVEDLIDCAEQLVRWGVTDSKHLAVYGASAGGLLAGAASLQHPDLFRAVVMNVSVTHLYRFLETAATGPGNCSEFGDPSKEVDFKGMLAFDPYILVRDGITYPSFLVSTGINDPRIPWSQSAKFVARLQASGSPNPVLFRLGEDGHSQGATFSQRAALDRDLLAFLSWQLGDPSFQPR